MQVCKLTLKFLTAFKRRLGPFAGSVACAGLIGTFSLVMAARPVAEAKAAAKAGEKAKAGGNEPIQILTGPPKTVGNPQAPQGGTLYYNLEGEPTTINPITSTDLYSTYLEAYVLDTLLSRDPDTYEWVPGLAESAEVSPDGKFYTFKLRKGAVWSDGKPIAAEDVKFSFDAIFDDTYNAAHRRPYFENIEKCEILDPLAVRFTAKTKYFATLEQLASGLLILPKHVYGDAKEGVKKNKTIVGSGPYALEKYEQGQRIVLARNKAWWGNSLDFLKGQNNFERIVFRFVKEETVQLEMLKKGEIDYQWRLTPEDYVKKAVGAEWGTKVLKVKTENKAPKSYGYVGWNLRKEMFKDRNVRVALQMLMNRPEMIKKFRYDMSLPATGPWYQQSEYADPSVKAIPFDPKKAGELLAKAGWKDSDGDGVLDKVIDGQKVSLAFTLDHGNKDFEKYLTMYQEDLRKAGVKMEIKLLEWNALIKVMDDQSFDAVSLAWGGGAIDYDPKQIWHSSSAVKGGSNFIGYANKEVDAQIDEARQELDKPRRVKLMRKVYAAIAADAPYAFFFNDKYVLYARSARMGVTKDSFKYDVGPAAWWAKP
jgi:peptide/nickel transport system substrate-binding protein/microcin C transport system substrate-binding protein